MLPCSWLLFDADGTLFDYETAESKALAATFTDAGLPYEPATLEIYREINAEMWAAFERGEISQLDLHLARFERTLDAVGVHADIPQFGERYLYNLGHSPDLIDGAQEVVTALGEADYAGPLVVERSRRRTVGEVQHSIDYLRNLLGS